MDSEKADLEKANPEKVDLEKKDFEKMDLELDLDKFELLRTMDFGNLDDVRKLLLYDVYKRMERKRRTLPMSVMPLVFGIACTPMFWIVALVSFLGQGVD
jgi:hypothetical protein